jgi:hypothetical protein
MAANTPAGMPTSSEIASVASASSAVAPARSNTSSPAGCPKRMDSPNSNRARLPSQTSSCSQIGRSSPWVSRNCCRTSSGVVGGSIMSVGSPDRRTRKKVATATPSSTGTAPNRRRSRKAAKAPRP